MLTVKSDSFIAGAVGPSDAPTYSYGLKNWSLSGLKNSQQRQALEQALSKALLEIGTKRVFAPNVEPSSGIVVSQQRIMREETALEGGVSLYRNSHLPADGTFLEVGDTFIMSSAGCPLVVATGGGKMIVAHAGRASLIDQDAIAGMNAREHFSVVYAIIAAFRGYGVAPHDIHMYVMFSIPKKDFVHHLNDLIYGERNLGMVSTIGSRWPGSIETKNGETTICLQTLIIEQAVEKGVVYVTATDDLSKHVKLTHTRDDLPKESRNLILAKRTN